MEVEGERVAVAAHVANVVARDDLDSVVLEQGCKRAHARLDEHEPLVSESREEAPGRGGGEQRATRNRAVERVGLVLHGFTRQEQLAHLLEDKAIRSEEHTSELQSQSN